MLALLTRWFSMAPRRPLWMYAGRRTGATYPLVLHGPRSATMDVCWQTHWHYLPAGSPWHLVGHYGCMLADALALLTRWVSMAPGRPLWMYAGRRTGTTYPLVLHGPWSATMDVCWQMHWQYLPAGSPWRLVGHYGCMLADALALLTRWFSMAPGRPLWMYAGRRTGATYPLVLHGPWSATMHVCWQTHWRYLPAGSPWRLVGHYGCMLADAPTPWAHKSPHNHFAYHPQGSNLEGIK